MSDPEKILLDAEIISVISEKAFWARLRNGHRLVAFYVGAPPVGGGAAGDWVRVELSPFDMSKGRIAGRAAGERLS